MNECSFCGECPCTCQQEVDKINQQNLIRLEMAMSVLRSVLPGNDYNISKDELMLITKPLSELHRRILSEPS